VDKDTSPNSQPTPLSVDVIILSWNRVDETIAAIASADTQLNVEKHIYIVDQGSDTYNLDRLKAFLDHVPCATLKILDENSGVAGGRNIATAMGSSPYVVALDNDAVFSDPYALSRAASYLDTHPKLCAIAFRITNYFSGENDRSSWDYPGKFTPDHGFLTTRFVGAGHAIRRSVFEKVGGYDSRLFFCGEEIDLCYRMLNIGYHIEYVPQVEILHKVSPQHRVFWGKGRFYFTVRNNLYTSYKFGVSIPRLIVAAGAFIIKGFRNSIGYEAFRAIRSAVVMCRHFSRSDEGKLHYHLNEDTQRYIRLCEPARGDGLFRKLLRQFHALPMQS
jgi:GT2 family glycosyltransferase